MTTAKTKEVAFCGEPHESCDMDHVWGCAEGATRDFSREKNILKLYIFGFPLGKHSPLVPLSLKLRPLDDKNLTKLKKYRGFFHVFPILSFRQLYPRDL
jgi:hypothetical protein